MSLVTIVAVVFGLSQVLLSLALLARLDSRGIGEKLFGLLMLANACYLLSPLLAQTSLQAWIVPWATAIPGLFWLLSASIFDDHFELRPWQSGLVAITVFFPMLGGLLGQSLWVQWLFFTAPQVLEFILMGLVFWVVAQHWSIDLVETRRRLRLGFVGINGAGVFLLIFSREVLFPGQAWLKEWEYVPAALLLFGINLVLLGYRGGVVFERVNATIAPTALADSQGDQAEVTVASDFDQGLVATVQAHMVDETAWREMGLTIGQLAQQLEVPQYRLRQAINAGLGYRNFSDFLNSYRIAETARRLRDPDESGLPVLTIAMDAGFRSLSSFNKAFKEAHGVTPTQFRKQSA